MCEKPCNLIIDNDPQIMPTVLAIDDKPDNLLVVKAVLKQFLPDIIVLAAQSGEEGLEIAQRDHPDVILLDILMPGMDGFEICKTLKGQEITRHIPLIMLTADKTDSRSRVKALELGADAFLLKPVDEVELVAQIKAMLRIKLAEDRLRHENMILEQAVRERTDALQEELNERKQMETRIRASLREKEVLIQEIYHRTKNNMAVICAMLSLQSYSLEDERIVHLLDDISNRIRSMALVHEKLYQSQDLSHIDLREYTRDLTHSLVDNCQLGGAYIGVHFDIEPLLVSIETAIPYGQILNELLLNALKHAFPERRNGEITVALHRSTEDDELNLVFRDNGAGMPPTIDFRDTTSFGMRLITLLAETQLRGHVEVLVDGGTEFHIRFKELRYKPRV